MLVVVHEVILASGEDTTHVFAARLAALFALDALEGDADFMTRTCDCRTHIVHKKVHKKSAFEQALDNALKNGDMDVNLDSKDDGMETETETSDEHRDHLVQSEGE
jgi:endoribonuclease Dicer